jgi:hypothetical protein
MVYVLIVLVLLSMVAAMLKLRPSAQERMLARVRNQAISAGFHVKIIGPKDLSWWPKDKTLPSLPVIAYWMTTASLKHQNWQSVVSTETDSRECANTSMSEREWLCLQALKTDLGQNLIAVEVKNSALWVYWIESEKLYPALMTYFQCYK